MLRTVLWISAAAAAVLLALWLSRGTNIVPSQPKTAPAEQAPAVAEAAQPAAAEAPEPEVPQADPPPTPDELQIEEDAAATGMTTLEPAPEPAPEAPPEPAAPPT